MDIESYDPATHYRFFEQWYHAHVPVPVGPEFLPKVGFVAPGLAMGFLYQTDSKMAYIEGLVANPGAPRAERNYAIDQVVLAIISEARALGFRALQGQTSLPVVIERAKRLGFTHNPTPFQNVTLIL